MLIKGKRGWAGFLKASQKYFYNRLKTYINDTPKLC